MNWRKIVLPAFDRYVKRNRIQENLATLRKFYALPIAEQRCIQTERLVALLKHAVTNVPYYRSVLRDAEVCVNGTIDLTRFANIPLLTKDILRDQCDQLKSDDLAERRWYRNTSGGSTGEPAIFIQDSHYHDLSMATKIIQYEWSGKTEGEVHIKLWGSDRDILKGSIGSRAKFSNFLRNQTLLNTYLMTETVMDNYITIIKQKKPKLIEAYVQSAYEIARYMKTKEDRISGVGCVITSAGTLFPLMRQEIEAAFQCNVVNRYGSREVGDMACQRLPNHSLEISHYTHLIEVVDPEGFPVQPGEMGEIVVTCLSNFAMPLIRYRIGDMGIPAHAEYDGSIGVVRLEAVTGRTRDVFITSSGAIVDGAYFTHLVFFRDWIKQFQFVQESLDLVVLRIVAGEHAIPTREELLDIEAKIQRVMGPACRVQIDFVTEILPTPSGKYRYTISKVEQDQPVTQTSTLVM